MKRWRIFKRLFTISFKLSKAYYFLTFFQAIVKALRALIGVYGLKLIIDGLLSGDYQLSLTYAAIILGAEVLILLLDNTLASRIIISTNKISEAVTIELSRKMMAIDYHNLEDPKILDLIGRGKFAIDQFGALQNFFTSLSEITYNIFVFISMASILTVFSPLILLVIVVGLILHNLVNRRASKEQVKIFNNLGPINRKYNYYLNSILDIRYAKDYRMYPLGELMYGKYRTFQKETQDYMTKIYKRIAFYGRFYNIMNYLQMFIIYIFIGLKSINEGLGVSTFVYITSGAMKANEALTKITDGFVDFRRATEMLAPIVELFDIKESGATNRGDLLTDEFRSLRFENVSFAYPNRKDKIVLDDVSFEINKGEKVSIVGLNGAGKTTIIKLICRLYEPTSGKIYYNDIEIDRYFYEDYLQKISVVFQDFRLLALSIFENIDILRKDRNRALECLKNTGISEKIADLPDGIDSLYSKEYNESGIELSGGEMQKIAIARAMYKNADIMILDEPTSALDPLAEAEIYENFAKLIKDKTAIFISHRMSSSVFCDRIVVLDQGHIQDTDTHKNLMKKKDGVYARLFTSQAEYYSLEESGAI